MYGALLAPLGDTTSEQSREHAGHTLHNTNTWVHALPLMPRACPAPSRRRQLEVYGPRSVADLLRPRQLNTPLAAGRPPDAPTAARSVSP